MPPRKKTTLRDIADKAGVSTALVSCILNGKGRASEEVRSKVLVLLEKAGYKPKHTRRSFYFLADLERVTESGKPIPVLRMVRGVEQPLEDEGVHLHVELLNHPNGQAAHAITNQLDAVLERQPGAVLVPTDEPWLDQACTAFSTAGVPLMQIGYDTENPRYPAVVVDSFAGGQLAARHLLARGHRRIGVIRWTYKVSQVNSSKKLAGFSSALADAGVTLRDTMIRSVNVGQSEPGWRPVRTLVEDMLGQPEPPTALFVDNSFISLPLLYPLPADNGRLPAHIAALDVVHFEDWPLDPAEDIVSGKLFAPPRNATVLAIDWETIGRLAARMLVDQVRGTSRAATTAVRVAPILQNLTGTTRTLVDEHTPEGASA